MKLLKGILTKSFQIGIHSGLTEDEIFQVSLLNRIVSIILLMNVIILVTNIFLIPEDVIIILGNIFILLLVVISQINKKIKLAKFIACLVFPSFLGLGFVLDSNANPGELFFLYGTISVVIFILYNQDSYHRSLMIIVNICICLAIVIFNESTYLQISKDNNPFDDILAFVLSTIAIIYILSFYQNNINKNTQILLKQKEELKQIGYMTSHDLKSPIRNILSFTKLLQNRISNDEDFKSNEYLSYIKRYAIRMNDLIEGVTKISVIDLTSPNELSVVDTFKILDNMKENLIVLPDEKRAQINLTTLPRIHFNKIELKSIFTNLIQNAVKFNNSGKPVIRIYSSFYKDEFQICFEDNGIGISSKYHKQIFNYFNKLHSQDIYPGSGLGLGLCKKIMEKYSGDISVESTPGKGSTFILHFPNTLLVSSDMELNQEAFSLSL